ncbi:hypothetical protein [Sphingomonas sp. PvP056]|jgi:hypothetical protein
MRLKLRRVRVNFVISHGSVSRDDAAAMLTAIVERPNLCRLIIGL